MGPPTMHLWGRPRRHPLVLVGLAAAWLAAAAAFGQTDGEPDPTFSGDGLLANGSEPYAAWTARALAVLPSQEVVVVGDLSTSVGMDHLRVSVPGDAITVCQAGVPLLADFEGLTALVDRAGRLVVAGTSTFTGAPDQRRGLIGRFTAGNPCAFDTGWSGNGWQILDGESFCDDEDCAVLDVAESLTGTPRLYALLSSQVNALVARLFVVGFGAGGEVDVDFGVDGYAEVTAPDLGTLTGLGAQLVVDGAGRPMVIASRYDPHETLDLDPFLLRLTAGGELDTSWAGDGFHILENTNIDALPAGLVVTSAGAVAFGYNNDFGTQFTGRAGMLTPDNSMDTNPFSARRIAGIAAQGDGKVLFLFDVGTDDDGMEIARLHWTGGDFNLDSTFGNAGRFPLDVDLGGANWEEGTALVLSTGRPWLAGRAAGDSGAGMFAMRLRSAFLFADGFELGSTAFWQH